MAWKKGIESAGEMRKRKLAGRRLGGNKPSESIQGVPGSLASLVVEWVAWLESRNYSERTLRTRERTLEYFLEWSQARSLERPEEITKSILESYQRHLHRYRKSNGQALGITTQRQRLGDVQRFFAWLCRQNHLQANPAADLDLPRQTHRHLPRGLSHEELAALLALPDTRDPLGIRDRALLETLYATGVRRSELANLDLGDLDLSGGTLHVREGKGGKSRMVPVGQSAVEWLSRYLEETRPRLLLDLSEQALFLSGYGERLSSGYLGKWVKSQLKEVGVKRPGSCHLLRHTCATHMLEGGADIRYVQQLLGHAQLDTTAIYTQVAISQLQEVYRRSHPSAK